MLTKIKICTPILTVILFLSAVEYTFAENSTLFIPFRAGNLAGADFAGPADLQLTDVDQTVLSVAITAPGPGVVIVNASGIHSSPAAALARCSITEGTIVENGHLFTSAVAAGPTFFRSAFAATRGFNVDSEATFTYNLVCDNFSGEIKVLQAFMTAMFFPVKY